VAEWPGAGKGDEGLKPLGQLLSQISKRGLAPQKAVQSVIKYYDPILKGKFDDFPRRQRDLEQLIPMADRYKKLRTFLDDLVLEPPTSSTDINRREKGDSLILSTVHSAKGLEWPFVFIIWAMEGYFPSARAYSNDGAIEEERRLMYVAATRAKDQLIICYPSEEARPAWQWGEAGYRSGLSSFIQALPPDVIEYGSSTALANRARSRRPVRYARIHQKDDDHLSELRPGDRVSHPAFGQGVISKFMDDEKVEVLFRDWGRKLLHLGYTTLEKM
jgi:DNA helicase-2/ATP-dependent DNA helicase PcrA